MCCQHPLLQVVLATTAAISLVPIFLFFPWVGFIGEEVEILMLGSIKIIFDMNDFVGSLSREDIISSRDSMSAHIKNGALREFFLIKLKCFDICLRHFYVTIIMILAYILTRFTFYLTFLMSVDN